MTSAHLADLCRSALAWGLDEPGHRQRAEHLRALADAHEAVADRMAREAGTLGPPPAPCPPVEIEPEGDGWRVVLAAHRDDFVVLYRGPSRDDAYVIGTATADIIESLLARGLALADTLPPPELAP